MCEEGFTVREIPPEKRDFNSHYTDDIPFAAVFDPSVKHQLIDAYGLDCYTETDDGLLFEFSFTNRDYLISWLLGFGGRVKVLSPDDIVESLQTAAKNILERYK